MLHRQTHSNSLGIMEYAKHTHKVNGNINGWIFSSAVRRRWRVLGKNNAVLKWNFIFTRYLKEFSLLFVNMCINILICLQTRLVLLPFALHMRSSSKHPVRYEVLPTRRTRHEIFTPQWMRLVSSIIGATSCRILTGVACCDLFLLKTGYPLQRSPLPFPSTVPVYCYCSCCHTNRQYSNMLGANVS